MNFNDIKFKRCDNSETDFKLLKEIHKISMQENVRLAIGVWNDDFQHDRLKSYYLEYSNTLQFVEYNNEIIGSINFHEKIFEEENEFKTYYIQQFYLKPSYQRTGLGTYLLNYFSNNKHVRLSVLKNDLKAIRFYKKNGFKEYDVDQYQLYLERR